MKEQETKVEVVWEGNTECLLVKRINYPIGDEAWAITHTIGNAEIVANDWHPETNDDERFPVLTALLTGESLDALAMWWLKRNPRLLAGLFTDEQKAALEAGRSALHEKYVTQGDISGFAFAQTIAKMLPPSKEG